jgi:polyketide cyclase/dehydrase/lipid transport protein
MLTENRLPGRPAAQREVRRLSIAIDRAAAEAYEFLSAPENFPQWATGLAGSLRKAGDDWIADTPDGRAVVRFSERNAYGVLDHSVTLPRGVTVYVPLRVVPKGEGCELVLTLFRRPGMSDEHFAADAEWVMRDLRAAKRVLEGFN